MPALAIAFKWSIGLPRNSAADSSVSPYSLKQVAQVDASPRPCAFAPGPTSDIANRGIAINAGHTLWPLRRKGVNEQSSATDSFQRCFAGQSSLNQKRVKFIPVLHCIRAAQHAVGIDAGNMKAPFQQDQVGLGMIAGKPRPPDPGISGGRVFRLHHIGRTAIDVEIKFRKPVPLGLLSRPLRRCQLRLTATDRQQDQRGQKQPQDVASVVIDNGHSEFSLVVPRKGRDFSHPATRAINVVKNLELTAATRRPFP